MDDFVDEIEALKRSLAQQRTSGPDAYRGADWFQITPAEELVFELKPEDLPPFVALQEIYEGLSGTGTWEEHSPFQIYLRKKCGMERAEIAPHTFINLAILCGLSQRKAHAWFSKHDFWCVRAGVTEYDDERPSPKPVA